MDTPKEKESSAVPIPEDFQKKVYALLEGANKQQLSFVRNCCNECENDMMKEEAPEFSTESMPS